MSHGLNSGKDNPALGVDAWLIRRPALVAMRFNADLQAKYNTLISAGKPSKVAITALMRKLIVLANALLRANRKWVPKTA